MAAGLQLDEPSLEQCYPPSGIHPLDGYGNGLAGPDQNNELSAPRDRGIEKVSLEQGVVLRVDRDDHCRIL